MAWWAWLIIWVVLVLALVAMLVLLGWWLFKKAMAVMDELGELGDKVARLNENVEKLAPEPVENAIALGYPEVARRRELHLQRKEALRQARREARVARGKLLINPPKIPSLPVPTARIANQRKQTDAR